MFFLAEREKLFDEVETDWAKRESKNLVRAEKVDGDTANADADTESEPEDNEAEECTTKGRNMALNGFYRIARNTMSMYFKNPEPPPQEVRIIQSNATKGRHYSFMSNCAF